MTPDGELLRRYTETYSESAFAELVERHLNLVYSAALRQVNGDAHLAQDVAQTVFADLARKAASIAGRPVLTGWLYTSAHFAAAKAVRTERRRHTREEEAQLMNQLLCDPAPDLDWDKLRPVLDAAMLELNEPDREAVLLRYFDNRSHAEIADRLGLNENAARMRVDRALEKLRTLLVRSGVSTTTAALSAVILANAVQVAPAGLAITISTAAALAGTTIATTAIATKAIAMTTLQKTLFAAALTAAVGTGIYEARRASALRNEVETLRLQQAPLADQIQQLTHERDDATTRVAALRNDNERLKRDTAEILRLRGDAARLRQSEQELAQMKAADAQKKSDPTETETKSLLARVKQLKQQLDQMPEKKIPELQFVTDRDWLIAVTKNPAETDTDARKALVTLRNRGKMAFAPMLRGALQEYINANNGLLPADIAQLRPYFQSPVDDAILQRYQLLHTGRLADVPQEEWLVAEKAPVDIDYDTRLRINNTSIGMVGIDAYPKQP